MAGAATPATRVLATARVEHVVFEYDHNPSSHSFGEEAVDALVAEIGAEPAQVFKTLVVELSDGEGSRRSARPADISRRSARPADISRRSARPADISRRSARPGNGLAVVVLPVPRRMSLKSVATAFGVSKAAMADPTKAERSSGYVTGGISPLGQRRALPTVIDASVLGWDRIYCSAGRRGLEIGLAPADLIQLTGAITADVVTG